MDDGDLLSDIKDKISPEGNQHIDKETLKQIALSKAI
jgi:hypothetical protein